jgi:hypothetical protein
MCLNILADLDYAQQMEVLLARKQPDQPIEAEIMQGR